MSIIKSFSVGNGDLFYIIHNSSNFTIIDCNLIESEKDRIVNEILEQQKEKVVQRFISTHPDEDHFHGLAYLDSKIKILNFYCVENNATKEFETADYIMYCMLKNSDKVFHLERGCSRKWMNEDGEDKDGKHIGSSGINILWPITTNKDYQEALLSAEEGGDPNNISPIITYTVKNSVKAIWMGDLEKGFMEKIQNEITLPEVDILFAPHHGRDSGKVPLEWLRQMSPKIVVIGEAPSDKLNYYKDFNTITQLSAGDVIFECENSKIHIYVSSDTYSVDFLDNESMNTYENYIGTLNITTKKKEPS